MTRHCTASIRSTWAATATAASRTSAGGEPTYAALHNRGLGNEGLYFEETKPYEGFLFAKCNGSAATAAPPNATAAPPRFAQLESLGGSVLAEQTFELHSTDCGTWTKLDFALAPKTGTNCVGIEVDSDPGGSLRVSPGPSKATRAFGVADGLPSA